MHDALVAGAPIAPDAGILLRALRYGVLPVPLACGGLQALAPSLPGGYALPFYEATADAMVDAVRRAVALRRDAEAWNAAVERAMAADFSWAANAAATEALYSSLLVRFGLARAA